MKKFKRPRTSTIILSTVVIIMAIALCVCCIAIIKLRRVNLFSKSILLSNNYFMQNIEFATDGEDASENNTLSENSVKTAELPFPTRDAATYLYYTGVDDELVKKVLSWLIDIENMDPDMFNKCQITDIALSLSDLYNIGNSEIETVRKTCAAFGITYDKSKHNLIDPINSKQIDIDYISQEGILPNGCEAVSATMLLNYCGVDISPEEFVDGYLQCEDVSIRWGCRYGPNPKYAYAGNPRSENEGWGCFAPVIVRALNEALPKNYSAKNLTGATIAQLKEYIDRDIPVAVWVTVNMEEVGRILQWQSKDGEETFLYPANEHCMALIGYDEDGFIFADPYESKGIVKYSAEDATLAFNSLGRQAVAILRTAKPE